MANDTILTPGGEHWEEPTTPVSEGPFLERYKFLGEYEDEAEKSIVRENIGVPYKDSVYTKEESHIEIDKSIKKAFERYLSGDDPHGILPKVEQLIRDFVKNDGSTPFLAPQQGVDPTKDSHLTTRKYVKNVLQDHINSRDPHKILPEVKDLLRDYVKESDIYLKDSVYTKSEIDQQATRYVKKDGTTPFTKPQLGIDPQVDGHLSTKRYVDNKMYQHLVDIDPHGYISLLNQRLANYAKISNVYDKTQTYSRVQIDQIIRSLVFDMFEEAQEDFNPEKIIDIIKQEKYVKQDGSVPFTAPQKGIDAVDQQDLVTLHQLQQNQPIWITSGPVESTVGHVEDNTLLPSQMTMQEILDAIFYGKAISITAPDWVNVGDNCDVTVCIHGSLALIDYAELYQDGELIYTFTREDFRDGCVTVPSKYPIYEDTEFEFIVYYTNGVPDSATHTVHCSLPVFIGLLPQWKFGNYTSWNYLQELEQSDTEGTQNRFINVGGDLTSVTFYYNFTDVDFRHPFIVVPYEYPDLDNIVTKSQQFGIDAFDVIDAIPYRIGYDNKGQPIDKMYKVYIYHQVLSSLNQEVTFNFKPKE